MNKRKRVAALKHRRRLKRYEVLRKAALLAGTASVQQARQVARPKLISTPLQEAVVTPARRTRRAPVKKPTIAEATPATETVVEAVVTPARRTRRAPVKKPTVAEATPATETVVEAPAPARRTRRAPTKEPAVAEATPATEATVETPAPAKRSRRSTAKQTDEVTEQPSTPAKRTRRKTSAKESKPNGTKTAADDSSGSSSS
jgi:hypothetical protein